MDDTTRDLHESLIREYLALSKSIILSGEDWGKEASESHHRAKSSLKQLAHPSRNRYVMDREKVQKLVNALVSCAIMIGSTESLQKMESNEIGDWIGKQLKDCGFSNMPCGSLHVYLGSENCEIVE